MTDLKSYLYGPGPCIGPARPMYGPSQGPCGRARAGPAHIWTRTFFRNSILKDMGIPCIIEDLLFDLFSKKARAGKKINSLAVSPRDLSHETDSGPKTTLFSVQLRTDYAESQIRITSNSNTRLRRIEKTDYHS